MKTLSNNLKQYRIAAGYTQQDVADKLNVCRSTYDSWENRIYTPSHDQIIALSTLYNVSIEMLVNGKEREFKNDFDCDVLIYVTVY